MRHFAMLTVAFALTGAGCSRPIPMPANQADYLPLAEGNEWYMDAVLVSPSGEVRRGTAHRVLEATVKRDGRTYLLSRTSIEFPPMAKQEYTKLVRKDESGFHSMREEDPVSSEQVEIALPLTVGREWSRTDGPMKMRDKVMGVETVEIGGIVFHDCCHIRSAAVKGKLEEDYWEAPKVGNVKSVSLLPDGSRMTITLHEFKPGQNAAAPQSR
jgi:hypothetical protein